GHEYLLQPARPVLLDALAEVDRVVVAHALPTVEHDRIVFAERFAEGPDEANVLRESLGTTHRAVPEEPFLRGVSELAVANRALAHLAEIFDRVAEHARICGHFGSRGSTQKAPDRLTERLSLDVPERAVDRGQRNHGVALPPVHLEAVHLVPKELGRERILAEEEMGKLRQHDPRRIGPDRPRDAVHAFVGHYLQEVLRGAEAPVVELLAARSPWIASILRVDVDGTHQPLFPQGPVGR